jgi:hypothetical protein
MWLNGHQLTFIKIVTLNKVAATQPSYNITNSLFTISLLSLNYILIFKMQDKSIIYLMEVN